MPQNKAIIYLLSPTPIKDRAVVHLPMITFVTTATSIEKSGISLLLFTSKEAVKRTVKIDKKLLTTTPAIAIGKKTAIQIEQAGGSVVAMPHKASAKEITKLIKRAFSNQTILYLRARSVATDIAAALLDEGITIKEQIIYETRYKRYLSHNKPPNGSILLFSSPSTIKAFMQNFEWEQSYKAVAIGETTYNALPRSAQRFIALAPTLQAMVKLAKDLAKK